MLKKIAIGSVAALTLAGLVGFASTDGSCHRGFSQEQAQAFIDYRVNDVLDDLDATDAQRDAILDIKDDLVDQGFALKADRQTTHDELKAQWQSDQPDAERIHQMVDEKADQMRGFAHTVADAVLEVHSILTPEQRNQALDLAEEARARHHGG